MTGHWYDKLFIPLKPSFVIWLHLECSAPWVRPVWQSVTNWGIGL